MIQRRLSQGKIEVKGLESPCTHTRARANTFINKPPQEFGPLRREALVALIATCPERVAPLLAALAFDPQLSFGTRLEVRGMGS